MKEKFYLSLCLLILLINATSCYKDPYRKGMTFAGGKYVSAETLNKGRRAYMENCFACHGVDGDGNGVAAKGLVPPPRNLKQGLYKFGEVVAGELLHDDTFKKIITRGLNGSAMLPWDIQGERLDALVQYVKSLAPETWVGANKKLGEKILPIGDPFGIAHKSDAIQKGKEVYHVVAQCWSCHRAYAPRNEIVKMSKKYPDYSIKISDLDNTIYELKSQGSEYGTAALPPDFTLHPIRSAQTVEELYVRLAAGVNGAAMPSWKGVIDDDQIWAVAYYVRYLMDLKEKPQRKSLIGALK